MPLLNSVEISNVTDPFQVVPDAATGITVDLVDARIVSVAAIRASTGPEPRAMITPAAWASESFCALALSVAK